MPAIAPTMPYSEFNRFIGINDLISNLNPTWGIVEGDLTQIQGENMIFFKVQALAKITI